MRSIVIYDSNFGNTKIIADVIAGELGGVAFPVGDIDPGALGGTDLLIIGSPINAWRPTAKISSLLSSLTPSSLASVKSAAFDTRIKIFISGNAAKRISKKLEEKGASIISEPKAFYVKDKEGPLVEGEIEHAKQWARNIIQKLKSCQI